VLDRELTYQMPLKRLMKLSRTAGRKAYSTSWLLIWLLAAMYGLGLAAWIAFGPAIDRWLAAFNLPTLTPLAVLIAFLILGIWAIRRLGMKQTKARADFDSTVRFREETDGVRLATPEIEYFVKWHGISQMMLLSDGLVFSHGNLFFMVPNEAFRDLGERDALARDAFGRLNPAARERSEKFIRPVLDASASTAGI
jgi:hypothetical protein